MYVMNAAGFNSISIKTNFPPYHNKTPITRIPKNSLSGDAIFCLLTNLFENLKNFELLVLNFDLKKFSDRNVLITLMPLITSSVIDISSACSFCTINDFFFKLFPIKEITSPEIGIKNNTNNVNLKLIINIVPRVKTIVSGSLIKISTIDR